MTQFDTAKFWNGVIADHNVEMLAAAGEKVCDACGQPGGACLCPDDLDRVALRRGIAMLKLGFNGKHLSFQNDELRALLIALRQQ